MVELIVGPSVRPSCGDGHRGRHRRSSSLGGNREREGERRRGGELEMGTACSSTCRDLGAVNRPTDQPAFPPPSFPPSSSPPSPSHEKENTRSWKVGRTDDGVKDGRSGRKGREGRKE